MLKLSGHRGLSFAIGLTSASLLGLALRVYLLADQVLIDDEWHGLLFIKGKTLFDVLTKFNPVQNSSPVLNVYTYLCYHTLGVSEWILRLPQLVTGSLLVFLFPLLLRRIMTATASVFYAVLLALSPFLIFYSRFSRAYILIAFLSPIGLLAAFRWFSTNQRRYAAAFILVSALAVYTHPSAVAMAVAPYLAYLLALGARRARAGLVFASTPRLPLKEFMPLGAVHALLLCLVSLNLIRQSGSLQFHRAEFHGGDVKNMLGLLCGSASWGVVAFILAMASLGFVRLLKRNAFLAVLGSLGIVVNVGFVLVLNPFGIESSAVFMRYCIAIIPIVLCFSAVGMDGALSIIGSRLSSGAGRRGLAGTGLIGVTAALYLSGPLPVIYRAPNSFTSHLAYQGNYAYGEWKKSRSNHFLPSYEISAEQVPAFYKTLASDHRSDAIIEYPFDFADHSNLLYFYQIVHRKRVLAGYCSDAARVRIVVDPQMQVRLRTEKIQLAYTRPEFFLAGVDVKSRTHLRNMVDINDDRALVDSGADYLVLHKVMRSIYVKGGESGNVALYDVSVDTFRKHFTEKFNPPVFEDDEIVVFALE